MSSSEPSWDDPRLTVFIIWGVFIFVVFFCIPSKRIVQRICHRFAIRCCGYEEEISTSDNNGNGGREVLWELLSPARKLEIDSLRASHLSYKLHPFSLTLEVKHMLTESAAPSSSASATTTTTTTAFAKSTSSIRDQAIFPQDGLSDTTNDIIMEQVRTAKDVEKGKLRIVDANPGEGIEEHPTLLSKLSRLRNTRRESIDTSDESEKGSSGCDNTKGPTEDGTEEIKQEEEEIVQYTHILIPPPGHNFDGIDITTLLPCTDKENNDEHNNTQKGGNYFRLRLFGGKTKVVGNGAAAKGVGIGDGGGDADNSNILCSSSTGIHDDKRKSKICPNVCTICLMEYEPSERVSWSSNKECTHVFHEDCITHWLVSLGRTKSKMLRFSEEPTEAQLLNYELECPCCRQEFILSNNMELGRRRGDENV